MNKLSSKSWVHSHLKRQHILDQAHDWPLYYKGLRGAHLSARVEKTLGGKDKPIVNKPPGPSFKKSSFKEAAATLCHQDGHLLSLANFQHVENHVLPEKNRFSFSYSPSLIAFTYLHMYTHIFIFICLVYLINLNT